MHTQNSIITSIEAALILGVQDSTVRRLIVAKKLPGFKKGKTWLMSREDVKKLKLDRKLRKVQRDLKKEATLQSPSS